MTENGEKVLVRLAAVFLMIAVAVMGYIRSLYRSGEESAKEAMAAGLGAEGFEAIGREDADIIIPLPDAEEDGFHVEEDLKDKKLKVVLVGSQEDYFYQNKIKGNEEKISQVLYRQNAGKTELQFILNDIYEADIRVKGSELYLTLENPAEQWDTIAVLEGTGWSEEAVACLEAQGIKGLVSGDIGTANELRADFFLLLSVEEPWDNGTQSAPDASDTGITIYYNDDYFIPDCDSKSYAEALRQYLAKECGEENVRIAKTTEWDLDDAMIPAVKIVCRPGAAIGTVGADEAVTDIHTEGGTFGEEKIAVLAAKATVLLYQEMEEKK